MERDVRHQPRTVVTHPTPQNQRCHSLGQGVRCADMGLRWPFNRGTRPFFVGLAATRDGGVQKWDLTPADP
eukprot:59408-Amphidinium_carterae.1